MPSPVLEWAEVTSGITVYPDLIDPVAYSYSPRISWGQLSSMVTGPLAMIHGEFALDLNATELQSLLNHYPGSKIVPLIPASVTNTLLLTIDVPAPHNLTLAAVNSFPYPKLILSGTIRMSEANATELLQKIQTAWKDHTIVSGKLSLTFSMVSVRAAYKIRLDSVVVHDGLLALIGNDVGSFSDVTSAIADYSVKSFATFAQSFRKATDGNLKREVAWYVAQDMWNSYVVESQPLMSFDGGRNVTGYRIREARELAPTKEYALSSSAQTTVDVTLI